MKEKDKQESIERTMALYRGKLALLQEWEQSPEPDPGEIMRLSRLVKYYHNQLVNKGAMCPNET